MKPTLIVIEGKHYRWRDLSADAPRAAGRRRQLRQLALFADLPADSRPAHERTAADRYRQPSLFTRLDD